MEVTAHLTEKARRDYILVQQAIRQGDQRAYAELLKNYRDSLYFMLLKMTNNPVDAEDLTIEAFGKELHRLPSQAKPDPVYFRN
jgi:RNA polymerase sigma-70 factor (ECF subfamily)